MLDAGTLPALQQATELIASIEFGQGYKVACLEEVIFFFKKFITKKELLKRVNTMDPLTMVNI